MKKHPRVEIITPAPTKERPFVSPILTRVLVDGEMWPVTAYRVESGVDNAQVVTLSFYADLTITHEPKP